MIASLSGTILKIEAASLIIGVGGVRTVADLQAKLAAGASLVQLYTGLVYAGPRLPGALLRGIAGLE